MRILIAPDSFKECLSADEVAAAIASGLPASVVVECMPLADGGEGTARLLTRALGGEIVPASVTGPLGECVDAFYGRVGDTAVLDVASACGLTLVPPEARNPLKTTSRGVGELMAAALRAGCRKLIVGLGGSATCDGGAGMMEALRGCPANIEIRALRDVDNPFVGPSGAARVFGPQKGASPAEVEMLEAQMQAMAATIRSETGVDVSEMKGAGAAGGIGGALAAYFGAQLCSGVETVLSLTGFSRAAANADMIITGEGTSDAQTLAGKVPLGVLRHSGDVPVVLISGRIRDSEALLAAGFSRLIAATPDDIPLSEALRPEIARENLRRAASLIVKNMSTFKVSEILTTPPPEYVSALQQKVYETFATLGIPYERVDTDPGLTMEDCQHIDAKIGVRIVKTVFLCNRQQTEFYLYVTTDDKPFVTREFCGALGIPRVSFAPAERLRALTGVEVGATTILSAILPESAPVHLMMDRAVSESEWFACTDGTPTCFVKFKTADLLGKYLPSSGHGIQFI